MQPRLSEQKYKALCHKARLSKVLPPPLDTQVDDDVMILVRQSIRKLAEERGSAATLSKRPSRGLETALGMKMPEQRMAWALLEFMDLPMISMPYIKPLSMAPSTQCPTMLMYNDSGSPCCEPVREAVIATNKQCWCGYAFMTAKQARRFTKAKAALCSQDGPQGTAMSPFKSFGPVDDGFTPASTFLRAPAHST